MLFSSEIFLFIFLPITLLFFYIIRLSRYKLELLFLSFFSLIFYAWNDPKWLILILSSVFMNFLFARSIYSNRFKYALELGVFFNLLLIGWFKYRFFFMNSFLDLTINLNIIIPLAISFFTFQQIALLYDVRDKMVKPLPLLDHLFFVSFFPQLIAGPIVLAKNFFPQIEAMKNKVNALSFFTLGLTIFFIGLFKKVFLADNIAPYVTVGFNSIYSSLTFIEAWSIISAFALQLYFDFSGYSEMAVGLGLLFGLRLPVNFNVPFKAISMIDFWKRWHITVTKFFMLYLYAPISLYINRLNILSPNNILLILIVPTILTFFVSGLWHGPDWKFIYFGLVNGLALIINHLWKIYKMPKFSKLISWSLTMFTVLVSFVFFRASNTADAIQLLSIMFNPFNISVPTWLAAYMDIQGINISTLPFFATGSFTIKFLIIFFVSFLLALKIPNIADKDFKFKYNWKNSLLLALTIILSLSSLNKEVSFIYFQF